MRIFVAGATGVLGKRLVPLLKERLHTVAGMTRSPAKIVLLEELGVEAILCDVYDLEKLRKSVTDFGPEIIIDMITDLPDKAADMAAFTGANNRIRREGTGNLISAAVAAGTPRFVAESVAWKLPGAGGEAVREMEEAVLNYGGTILRYGQLYGPGTYYEGEKPPHPRVSVDSAAEMTIEHLYESGKIIDIVDVDAP